jgi:hypothetical protein
MASDTQLSITHLKRRAEPQGAWLCERRKAAGGAASLTLIPYSIQVRRGDGTLKRESQ